MAAFFISIESQLKGSDPDPRTAATGEHIDAHIASDAPQKRFALKILQKSELR
jgi:hypothetical protein